MHLVVLIPGLFGQDAHCQGLLNAVNEELGEKDQAKVIVSRANSGILSLDGIDVCGLRLSEEIESALRISGATSLSVVGYSMGGLYGRYALGYMKARGKLKGIRLRHFAAFASPWVGIPLYLSWIRKWSRFLGSFVFSRTGLQLHFGDSAEHILNQMCDPAFTFYKTLASFESIALYANVMNETTVMFSTGAVEAHDPFHSTYARAWKLLEQTWRNPSGHIPEILKIGGLDIEYDAETFLVTKARRAEKPSRARWASWADANWQVILPFFFRPSFFNMRLSIWATMALLVPFWFPIFITLLGLLIIKEFVASQLRIRKFTPELLVSESIAVQRDPPSVVAELPAAFNGKATQSQTTPEETSSTFAEGKIHDDDPKGLVFTLSVGKISKKALNLERACIYPGLDASEDLFTRAGPHDPRLSPEEVQMIEWINTLPIQKFLVYFPSRLNSHTSIVARDNAHEKNAVGKSVLRHWARTFIKD